MNFVTPTGPKALEPAMWEDLPTYFRQAVAPIREWLENPDVIEISCNGPGVIFVEAIGWGEMKEFNVPELTSERIKRLAVQVAGQTDQSVNEETPLISAAMPNGARFQGILPPASPTGGAFSIRKQVVHNLTIEDYFQIGAFDNVRVVGPLKAERGYMSDEEAQLVELLRDNSAEGRVRALRFIVEQRFTTLVSGGTSSGKTTLLNALIQLIPAWERLASLEDTREVRPPHRNYLPLLASKGGQGLSRTTIQDLLEAVLRMRPERFVVGEIRGAEAFAFVQCVNTGHPGSFASIHCNDARIAYERCAVAAMQANMGLSKADLIELIRATVPVVVHVARDRRTGRRGVTEIYFDKWVG